MSNGEGAWGPRSCAHPLGLTGPLLLGSYTRDHPLFLQLKDYFWVKTPSLYELPYGTKGSGKSCAAASVPGGPDICPSILPACLWASAA